MYRHGLLPGKFSPLHQGHQRLIESALGLCETLSIVSWAEPEFPGCEAPRRRRWLELLYGDRAIVRVYDPREGPVPANDSADEVQRAFCVRITRDEGWPVDAVITTETYGAGLAAFMERELGRPIAHHFVAHGRLPGVTGTLLRDDPEAFRTFVDPRIWADFRAGG